jgi:hypothetical protein
VLAYHWHLRNGYAAASPHVDMQIYLHHLIAGKPSKGFDVDHINGDKLDNRRGNLRVVTHQQNTQNIWKPRANATSRFRGVGWFARDKKWRATVTVKGRIHQLGLFDTEEEAARVASDFRAKHLPFSEADAA